MVCQVQLNSIKYLEKNGATDDVRRIINEDKFNELNDKLTQLAEQKYGLKTDGAKLFSTNTSEHIDPWRSTYWRDAKYRVLRAEPNKPLFDRLQELFNGKSDQLFQLNKIENIEGKVSPEESLYGTNKDVKNLVFNDETLAAINSFIDTIGVDLNLTNFSRNDVLAAANFINRTIDIAEDLDKRVKAWNKLPEEAAHWWYRLLKNDSTFKNELWTLAQNSSKKSELMAMNYGEYGNEDNFTEEAIGQLIAESIKRIETNSALAADKSLWKRIINFVKTIINKFKKEITTPFDIAAAKILASDVSDLMTQEEYAALYTQASEEVVMENIADQIQEVTGAEVIADPAPSYFDYLTNKKFKIQTRYLKKTIQRHKENVKNFKNNIVKEFEKNAENFDLIDIKLTFQSKIDLFNKFKQGIALASPIKLDGVKKQELEIINTVREAIKSENPSLKTISTEDFVNEVENYINEIYKLQSRKLNKYTDYRVSSTFTSNKPRHTKIGIHLNNEYFTGVGHFGYDPFAWYNLTPFNFNEDSNLPTSVLLHEIQTDFLDQLKETKSNKNLAERYISNLVHKNDMYFGAFSDSLAEKKEFNSSVYEGFKHRLIDELGYQYDNVKNSLQTGKYDREIDEQNAKVDVYYKIVRAVDNTIINNKEFWKEFSNEYFNAVKEIKKNEFAYSSDISKVKNDVINKYRDNLVNYLLKNYQFKTKEIPDMTYVITEYLKGTIKGKFNAPYYLKGLKKRPAGIPQMLQTQKNILKSLRLAKFKNISFFNRYEKIKNLTEDEVKAVYNNLLANQMYLESVLLDDFDDLDQAGKIEYYKKFTEIYLTPVIHHAIQSFRTNKAGITDLRFSGGAATILTQGNPVTAELYAGPEEVETNISTKAEALRDAFYKFYNGDDYENIVDPLLDSDPAIEYKNLRKLYQQVKKDQNIYQATRIYNDFLNFTGGKFMEVGFMYTSMSKMKGIKLIYEDTPGLINNTKTYRVELNNYNLSNPVLYGIDMSIIPQKSEENIKPGVQEVNGVLFMDINIEELQNERSREVAEVLAQRLSQSIGAKFENVTPEEAANILKNRSVKYNGEPAFYYAGTVYIVGDNVNVRTVLHEFAHPVLQGLRRTNNILFQNLYNQALATEEGQGIYYYVLNNYPELDPNSDLFKEEVLAFALQLKALNKINNEIETDGYQSFMNKLLAAIKQFLRGIFGSKVNVAKLDVDTSLEEMADMLLDKDFEFNTIQVTEEDVAMFSRNVLERAKELAKLSDKKTQEKIVGGMYDYNRRILTEAESFKGDKASRKLLKEAMFQKGTDNYMRSLLRTLKDNLNNNTDNLPEDQLIQNALDNAREELDEDLQRAMSLVNSLDSINSMTKNMLMDISKLSQTNINNRSTIALLMLYKSNSKAWLKMVQDIDEALTPEGQFVDTNNPFYMTLNEIVQNITRINTNIANILKNNNIQFYVEITGYMSKYVQDRLRSNLGVALKRVFTSPEELEREIDDLYNKVVQQTLTDADIDALVQKGVPADILKGFLKEYKDLVVDEDKIKAALTGGAHDVSWFNRWLESYSSSNDVVVGPLAMFIQNEKSQVQNLVWEKSMKFRGKLEKLLPRVGFSKLNSIAMREKMGFKDKVFWVDKETGKPIEKEVWSYLGAFKDYRYHYDLLEWNLEEAKKTEDTTKIAQAQFEFDQFKKDYMWQEFVPEFYEKDDIFKKSEVGQLAYYVRGQKLKAYNNLLNSMENELERFEKYSTIQAKFREFQQLYSLNYEDGTPKVDDPANGVYDLSIAQVLLEHRAATKEFYEWRPIENLLQDAYNEFTDLLATKNIFPGSAEFRAEVEKWRRQNLRMEFSQDYWDSRVKLISELKELQTKMNEVNKSKFDVSGAFQLINDLIYSYRDEQGEPDSEAMGKSRLEKIRDTEQAIADFKFQFDMSTGLSKEDSDELDTLAYKARKGLIQPGSAESKRYMYLLQLQEKEGINPADSARIQEIFSELSELTESLPTVKYLETLNYNLSKQNISEVNEEELDEYINSDEFQDILDADDSFREWFELNHYVVQRYDNIKKEYEPKYKRTKANTVAVPKDKSHITFTKIIDREGNEIELMGAPNARHSRYEVKDKYRTIPFGASKEDYVGKFIDNKNQWLPRLYDPSSKYSAVDKRFINERYFQMQAGNTAEYELLEAIKEYHLENQKGMSNYSKLYLDMPRYATKRGDIYQALQRGTYGSRFSELGKNVKEWYKQALGKSVMDAENDLNYDPSNNLVNTDLNGNQITYIPVSGIYNLDIDVQDADIFQGLFRYALSIQTQGKLLESLPLVNSILETLEDPDNAPKELEKFDKNIYSLKGALQMAKKKFSTNNRLGQVKSLIEREYYGKMVEGIEETHPRFGKWIQGLQGLSATGSLAINIPSDLKNKYGAYIQLIIEGAGAEFVSLKDIALARPWAEKAMLEWTTKGIYQTGPGAISTQLVQIFDPTFKFKDEFGREVERSMVKDLANMQWLYMHRKFGEMQVAMSLFGAFLYGQKVDQILGDGTKKSMRYVEAWEKDQDGIIRLKPGVHPGWSNVPVYHEYTKGESLESIAKKYYITVEELKAKNRIKSEVQLEDGQELVIAKSELFLGLKNRIQGTSRKLFGVYDDMGQPEGNKLLLYRMFFFMRKWFTPMLMNRFGFDSKTVGWTKGGEKYDWATSSYGKGFYITAFQAMLKTVKSGFRDYNYLTDQEKTAVRKFSAEAFFAIGLALLGLMIFGFDPDDDEKWKKLRAKSGAINQDTFNTYGFLSNHMLLLLTGVQAETSAFIPLPSIKGINFGADDYTKMITQTSSAWYNTVVLYIDIFGDVLDFVTFSEMDRYKRDEGPYSWKEKGDLKIWNKLFKTFGFTGGTGDPATTLENQFKSQSKGS